MTSETRHGRSKGAWLPRKHPTGNKRAVPASNSKTNAKQKGRHARAPCKPALKSPGEGRPHRRPPALQRLSRGLAALGGGEGPHREAVGAEEPQPPGHSGPELVPGLWHSRVCTWDNHCEENTAKRGSDSKSSASRSSALAHQSPPGPVPTGGNPLCTRLRRTADLQLKTSSEKAGREGGGENERRSTPSCEQQRSPGRGGHGTEGRTAR